MADYPKHLVHEHKLFDGRRVLVRPVRETDEALEREFLSNLSADSRYLRFQKWTETPSDKLLGFLTHVDYDRHLALVCVVRSETGEKVVGEARYVTNADGKSCDFAIVIADGWHKSGIAGLLMNALIGAARERGLSTMEGQVLSCNGDMLRFARALGFELQHVPDDLTVMRIVKTLQTPRDWRPAGLPRAARAAQKAFGR